MNIVNTLTQLVSDHTLIAYLFIFFGILIEGELVLIATGVLAHVGVLPAYPTLFIGFLGAIGKTALGYYTGSLLGQHFPHNLILKYSEHKVLSLLPRFRERPFWSIFISKFVYGINNLVIIFAGYTKAQFKIYIKAEILSTAIWVPLIFSLGYFFSHTAFSITRDIKKSVVFILVFLILFMIFEKVITGIISLIEEYKSDRK